MFVRAYVQGAHTEVFFTEKSQGYEKYFDMIMKLA